MSRSSAASSVRRLRRRVVLGVRRPHQQRAGLPVGLEVDPRDQPVAEQERQHVVAVHPLLGRDVDLDPVVEAEEVLGPPPEPDQRVERHEQGAGVDPRAAGGRRGAGSRAAVPPLDLDGEQLAGVDQRGDRGLRVVRTEPEVVAQAGLARDPVRPGRDPGQLDERLLVGEVRRVDDVARQDPLGHGVPALEGRGAAGRADLAGVEEELQGPLDLRPVPAPVDLRARDVVLQRLLDLAGGHRAPCGP